MIQSVFCLQSLNSQTVKESEAVRDFFTNLIKTQLKRESSNARLDFLACNAAHSPDAQIISRELQSIIDVSTNGRYLSEIKMHFRQK